MTNFPTKKKLASFAIGVVLVSLLAIGFGVFIGHWRRFGVFIVNFEHILHLVLLFLLLTLSRSRFDTPMIMLSNYPLSRMHFLIFWFRCSFFVHSSLYNELNFSTPQEKTKVNSSQFQMF